MFVLYILSIGGCFFENVGALLVSIKFYMMHTYNDFYFISEAI
ncbi:hypothetical protein VCHA43P273_520002 [Vibrio chagasii]|nr:hypothetical protein VCHA43P273_520002 [Vibrio chagasii]CAH7470915.1 hypothetical protein VCHA41O245_510002 [Vibrio chagasii]